MCHGEAECFRAGSDEDKGYAWVSPPTLDRISRPRGLSFRPLTTKAGDRRGCASRKVPRVGFMVGINVGKLAGNYNQKSDAGSCFIGSNTDR